MSDNLGLMPSIFAAALAVMTEKARTYGESWKARGGRGAWYTLVRPMDRLQKIVEQDHQGDIFAAVSASPEGGDGSALDAIRDLRNYLTLVEAEMTSRGVVAAPEKSVILPAKIEISGSTIEHKIVLEDHVETCHDMGQSREPWLRGLHALVKHRKEPLYTDWDLPDTRNARHKIAEVLSMFVSYRSRESARIMSTADLIQVSSRILTDGSIQLDIRIP